MQIAVASGKGGTGKTMVATSLALSLAAGQDPVWLLDCDVEAPNAHLFLQPDILQQQAAVILIPEIQSELCTLCGKCVEVCQFNALAKIGKSILVFDQLCHGCGSCCWNCQPGAIREVPKKIGMLESGLTVQNIHFSRGVLSISEPMPTPIIRQLKKAYLPSQEAIVILDSPPGASCSVVETLRGADYALLVTEPSPFGLHDLAQMVGIAGDMRIPAGVIVNRENEAFLPLDEFCKKNHLPVLMHISYNRKIAEGIARGKTLIEIYPHYAEAFLQLYDQIKPNAKK